jgi:MFS family permease
VGFGGGFQGAIRTVLPVVPAHHRSGVLSLIYVVSYLALGLPAVIAGFLVVHGGGIPETAREYGVAVMVLAALALAALARTERARRAAEPVVVPASRPAAPVIPVPDYNEIMREYADAIPVPVTQSGGRAR